MRAIAHKPNIGGAAAVDDTIVAGSGCYWFLLFLEDALRLVDLLHYYFPSMLESVCFAFSTVQNRIE